MPATTTHVRLLLLAAATALFVIVWAGDHPARSRRTAAATAARVPAMGMSFDRSANARHAARAAETATLPETDIAAVPPDEPWFAEDLADPFLVDMADTMAATGPQDEAIPLPPEIVAGEYRIVAQDGTVSSLTLTAGNLAQLGYAGTARPRETYRIREGMHVWHFVRVGLDGATLALGDEAPIPAAQEIGLSQQSAVELSELGTLLRPLVEQITTAAGERLASWWAAAMSRRAAARRAAWDGLSTMAEEIGHALRRLDWSARQATAEPAGRRL